MAVGGNFLPGASPIEAVAPEAENRRLFTELYFPGLDIITGEFAERRAAAGADSETVLEDFLAIRPGLDVQMATRWELTGNLVRRWESDEPYGLISPSRSGFDTAFVLARVGILHDIVPEYEPGDSGPKDFEHARQLGENICMLAQIYRSLGDYENLQAYYRVSADLFTYGLRYIGGLGYLDQTLQHKLHNQTKVDLVDSWKTTQIEDEIRLKLAIALDESSTHDRSDHLQSLVEDLIILYTKQNRFTEAQMLAGWDWGFETRALPSA